MQTICFYVSKLACQCQRVRVRSRLLITVLVQINPYFPNQVTDDSGRLLGHYGFLIPLSEC